jgi:hypothetical protein
LVNLQRAPIFLATMILLVGCSAPSPPPSPGGSEVTGRPTTAASPSRPAALESPWLESGTLDQQFTTPALEYHSTGTFLVWSSGARADPDANVAPDLFGSEPGSPVSLLYDNPNRDSRLELVGGEGDRIVFVEDNVHLFGPGRWKMWYLPNPGAAPQLIDEGSGSVPFFDLSGARLVWTVSGGEANDSQLWLLDLETMERRLLLSADADRTEYWFPAIDGHLVVYGALELTPDGQGEERHIYLLDVDGDMTPRRLDASQAGSGFGPSEPDIRGDIVVWKESTLAESHLVGGRLVRYSLRTGEIEPLTLNPDTFRHPGGDRYIFPSIGNRFVAAWGGYDRALYLADLETGTPLKVLDLGPIEDDPHDAVGLIADLVGDLLAYVFQPAGQDLELRWIVLR